MNLNPNTYSVDQTKYASFVEKVSIRRIVFSLTVFVVVKAVFSFLITQFDKDFPRFLLLFIVGTVLLGALWWAHKSWVKTLRKFQDATFEISLTEISMSSPSPGTRSISFDQIAVIDKTPKGTVLVRGNSWTKLDYYRPKRSGTPLDSPDRIFIPRVTDDYEKLLERIKPQ